MYDMTPRPHTTVPWSRVHAGLLRPPTRIVLPDEDSEGDGPGDYEHVVITDRGNLYYMFSPANRDTGSRDAAGYNMRGELTGYRTESGWKVVGPAHDRYEREILQGREPEGLRPVPDPEPAELVRLRHYHDATNDRALLEVCTRPGTGAPVYLTHLEASALITDLAHAMQRMAGK